MGTVGQGTPKVVRWRPYVAEWLIFARTAPPTTPPSPPSRTAKHASRYAMPEITAAILTIVRVAGPTVGFTPEDVSARSLCAGGATAPLTARADPYIIRPRGEAERRYRSALPPHHGRESFTDGPSSSKFLIRRLSAHSAGARLPGPVQDWSGLYEINIAPVSPTKVYYLYHIA